MGYLPVTLGDQRLRDPCAADGRASSQVRPTREWTRLSLLSARGGLLWGTKFGPPSPKAPIRFAVGEPRRRSSVWLVWANSNKGDVYITSRKSARIFKISLHESGNWRCQRAKDDHEDVTYHPYRQESVPQGRILARWQRRQRPLQTRVAGLTRCRSGSPATISRPCLAIRSRPRIANGSLHPVVRRRWSFASGLSNLVEVDLN